MSGITLHFDLVIMWSSYIFYVLFAFLLTAQEVLCEDKDIDDVISSNEISHIVYKLGVDRGIIDEEKYTFETFKHDEENVFKGLYQDYNSYNQSEPKTYEEWLILNNYGLLADTQESLLSRKIVKRSTADNKRRFVNTVRKGDILITGRGLGGFIGHAAIMTTDYYVLEMPGGRGFANGIRNNNRQISKHKWFDEHARDWTKVYRCPNAGVAKSAAVWADHNYWNPSGGKAKKKHITYKIDVHVTSKNPSYCSKLVIQAYYFGSGRKKVIRNLKGVGVIVPTSIPNFFLSPYKLKYMGKF